MTTTQVPCPIYTRWMFPRNDGAGWLDGGWGTEDPGAGITGFVLRSATGAGGIGAGAIGFSYIRGFGDNLEWRGQNGKWYPIKPAPGKTRAFRGSGSVGGRTRPLMMGKALRHAGRGFAVVNVGLSLNQFRIAVLSGNTGDAIWYGADAAVGVVSVAGGPIGLVGAPAIMSLASGSARSSGGAIPNVEESAALVPGNICSVHDWNMRQWTVDSTEAAFSIAGALAIGSLAAMASAAGTLGYFLSQDPKPIDQLINAAVILLVFFAHCLMFIRGRRYERIHERYKQLSRAEQRRKFRMALVYVGVSVLVIPLLAILAITLWG